MDLPTYTNIWRIEKRLYKLYDFNLPMPLPIVQVGVFLGVFVFWVVFLRLVRVPFEPPWHVLYLVPPTLVTYLITRPVLEGKRLPELLISQVRYLAEPRTWCRLVAVHEPERVTMRGSVWRYVKHPPVSPARHAKSRAKRPDIKPSAQLRRVPPSLALESVPAIAAPAAEQPPAHVQPPARERASEPIPQAESLHQAESLSQAQSVPSPARPPFGSSLTRAPDPPAADATTSEQSIALPFPAADGARHRGAAEHEPPRKVNGNSRPATSPAPRDRYPDRPDRARPVEDGPPAAVPSRDEPDTPTPGHAVGGDTGWRRVTRVIKSRPVREQPPDAAAEGELAVQASATIDGRRRVVVLGTVPGAGQTTTTLMMGHALAQHRADRCVAVDANPGPDSLAHRSRKESPETLASLLDRIDSIRGYVSLRAYTSQAGSGLEVIASDEDAMILTSFEERDFAAAAAVFDRYYTVSVFDPAAQIAPHVLPLADQLVLVAPGGSNAGRTIDTTLEWLRQHGHGRLASAAVLVINGVGKVGGGEVEQVAASAAGRCRDVVAIPWDDRLRTRYGRRTRRKNGVAAELDTMHQATRNAFLRLAATLVASGLARVPDQSRQEASR